MKKILFASLAALTAIVFYACTTDVELNAPYDSRTVVFGLLDPGLDTQWVKINRTWLGDGDNRLYAQIQDSSEYQDGDFNGVVEEYLNNILVNTYQIEDTILENKDDGGIFFSDQYKAYYFLSPGGLNTDSRFDLNLDFTSKDDVTGSTSLIETLPGTITRPPTGFQGASINWGQVVNGQVSFIDYNFKWNASENARRYEATLVVHITEYIYADQTQQVLLETVPRELNWFLGNVRTIDGSGELSKEVAGEAFFGFLANNLEASDNIRRELGIWNAETERVEAFDFVLTVGDEDLDTYLNVNEPLTGVIQERPDFTNLVNGLGLFSSKTSIANNGVEYQTTTLDALRTSPLTNGLNFCSPNPNNTFFCDL